MSKTFKTNKETKNEGEYILNKKNLCNKINTECIKEYNTGNLNNNLFTTLDLTDVIVIKDISNNISPVPLNNILTPFLNYTIDPSGQLFGTCNNTFLNYQILKL